MAAGPISGESSGHRERGSRPESPKAVPIEDLAVHYNGPDTEPSPGALTLAMRNVPHAYTSESFIRELESAGLQGSYDFIYLPQDFRRRCNIGFAFVNFVNHEAAHRCFLMLSGRTWSLIETNKICRISTAYVQGLVPNILLFFTNSGSYVGNDPAPIVFEKGHAMSSFEDALRMFCPAEWSRGLAAYRCPGHSAPRSADATLAAVGLPSLAGGRLQQEVGVPALQLAPSLPKESLSLAWARGRREQDRHGERQPPDELPPGMVLARFSV